MRGLIGLAALLAMLTLSTTVMGQDSYADLYKAGQAALQGRNYEAGRALMAQALEKAETPDQRARCLLATAGAWRTEKKLKEARNACDAVIEMGGVSAARRCDAMALSAKILFEEKNYPASRAASLKILVMKGIAPAVAAQAQLDVGVTYYYEQKRPLALEEFKKVIAMPDAPDTLAAVACFLGARCAPDAAAQRDLLGKILTLKDAGPKNHAEAHFRITRTYVAEKNFDAARAQLDQVLKMEKVDDGMKKRVAAELEQINEAARQAKPDGTPQPAGPASRIIPTPQQYEAKEGRLVLVKDGQAQAVIVLAEKADRKEELAAEYIAQEALRLSKAEVPVLRGAAAEKAAVRIRLGAAAGALPQADAAFLKSEKTGQGYVLDAAGSEARIVGSSPQGTLFGAMTLLQMMRREGADIVLDAAHIQDYPDFREREAAYAYVSSPKAVESAQQAVDFALRHKLNVVPTATSRKNYTANAASVRLVNAYARERGIRGMLYISTMGTITPPDGGEHPRNRRSYPDGEVYSCIHEIGRDPTRYCVSNDALHALIAGYVAEYIRRMEPGHVELHHIDNDRWAHGEQMWQRRCEQCRKQWPSDDLVSMQGLAGAQANFWNRVIEAVHAVRNADSGYEARRDCILRIVPPIYCNSSEDDETFAKELALYRAIAGGLRDKENVFLTTRELGRQRDGQKRFQMMGAALRENGVGYMGWIWAGGREDAGWPQSHTHHFWHSALPAMLKSFEGADHVLVAGNDTPISLLISAEYAWNHESSGYWRDPRTDSQWLQTFRSLGKSRETPPEIYGPGGFIERACVSMVGETAGAELAKGFLIRRTMRGRTITPLFNFAAAQTAGAWEKSCKAEGPKRPEVFQGWEELWRTYAEIGQEAEDVFRSVMKQDGYKNALPYVRRHIASLMAGVQQWRQTAAANVVTSASIAAAAKQSAPAAPDASSWPRVARKAAGSVIEVGVFDGPAHASLGAKSIALALQGMKGVKVRILDALTPDALSDCDVLAIHASKALPEDWRAAAQRFAGEGRGILLMHDAVGYRGFGASLFPDIVVMGVNNPRINRVKIIAQHPATKGFEDVAEFRHSYVDHILLEPGKGGVALLGEAGTEIGHGFQPVLVVGEYGHGRAAFSGILFGYNDGTEKADPEEGRLLSNLVRWLAEPRIQ